MEVEAWLKDARLEMYLKPLLANGYDSLAVIAAMEMQDFEGCGIILPPGHAKKFETAIARLRQSFVESKPSAPVLAEEVVITVPPSPELSRPIVEAVVLVPSTAPSAPPSAPPVAMAMRREEPTNVIDQKRAQFNSGLFECHTDVGALFEVCCCSCIITGRMAENIPPAENFWALCSGVCLCNCIICFLGIPPCGWPFGWCCSGRLRSKIQRYQGVPEEQISCVGNACLHTFCFPCAVTQELRYVRSVMGKDVHIM